jgi:hypothetical protein
MDQNAEVLIEQGNEFRTKHRPVDALRCYAQAFVANPDSVGAFNNYGNVLRECGQPARGIPFLQAALAMAPDFVTAKFNLAVAYLLMGDYERGWPAYESRWQYEHLNGLLPKHSQPRWTGQDLKDKTILVHGEQGLGDCIQFARFVRNLKDLGANVILQVNNNVGPLFADQEKFKVLMDNQVPDEFDYWTPIMSVPGYLGITLENLNHDLRYLAPSSASVEKWGKQLGLKKQLRVGFCWSGRRDSWINQHKSIPFETMLALIERNPDYEWINLQVEATEQEVSQLKAAGVNFISSGIQNFQDTAGLMMHLDVVISVDTAVAHLAGALGRAVWIPLSFYGLDWRWLLNRKDSPWYPSARLFRQEQMGNWSHPLEQIHTHLKLFKI